MPTSRYVDNLADNAKRLARVHLDLPARQAQIIVLESIGLSHTAAAELLQSTTGSVRNGAYAVRRKVAESIGHGSRNTVIAWAWMHSACCLPHTMVRLNGVSGFSERVIAIRKSHYTKLSERRELVLVSQAVGLDVQTAAERLSVKAETIRFHNDEMRAMLLPPGSETSQACLLAWAYLHAQCCLEHHWQVILARAS